MVHAKKQKYTLVSKPRMEPVMWRVATENLLIVHFRLHSIDGRPGPARAALATALSYYEKVSDQYIDYRDVPFSITEDEEMNKLHRNHVQRFVNEALHECASAILAPEVI